MKKLTLIGLLATLPALGAETYAREPRAVFCIARLMLFADLVAVEDSAPRLVRLRQGVQVLNRIEHSGRPADYQQWKGTAALMEEPLLAVEADAILETFLNELPDGISRDVVFHVQQHARRAIAEQLRLYRVQFRLNEGAKFRDAASVADFAKAIFEDLHGAQDPDVEASILLRLEQLARAEGFEANQAAYQWNRAILSLVETLTYPRLQMAARANLARLYLSWIERRPDLSGEQMSALLRRAASGDARTLLTDLEDRRAGRAPVTTMAAEWIRSRAGESLPSGFIAARARTFELSLQMLDGRHLPHSVSSDLLKASLEMRPPVLPGGEILDRVFGRDEDATILMLAAINLDPRGGEAGMRAVDSALLLVGDPRVDGASLKEWVISILGERRFFGEEQFLRFLQEAHAIRAKVVTLGLDRIVTISREHRNDTTEDLSPSFDFHVLDAVTRVTVESVEIKQTERPLSGSDIGGIIKQATRKLEESALRQLPGRKSLFIQFPWSSEPLQYARGGLILVLQPNGVIEKWRPDRLGQGGGKVGEENLFAEMAKHIPKVKDSDLFWEIVMTDTDGRPVARFRRPDDAKGQWAFVDETVIN